MERIVKMTNDALCFCLFWRKHAQCGVIMVRDSEEEAFVEMWVEQRGDMRTSSAYFMQHKCHNHLFHSEYCLIKPFYRTGKNYA